MYLSMYIELNKSGRVVKKTKFCLFTLPKWIGIQTQRAYVNLVQMNEAIKKYNYQLVIDTSHVYYSSCKITTQNETLL